MTEAVVRALPRALEPWRDWLGWFDAELAELLGDLLLRLADLVGPVSEATRPGGDEPDGLGDIRTRGTYERLLASEWLLAEEVPDEFARRAATSEHLFLAPRLRTPKVDRTVVALFDAGPLQLGAPRLAHIAAWILLARRALDQGGVLQWGLLQRPGELHAASSASALAALLRARTFRPATPEDFEGWTAHLSTIARPTEAAPIDIETWHVGPGPEPGTAIDGWRELIVRLDVLGTGLEVERRDTSSRRTARLPIPPDRAAVALLRGEFQPVVAPATRLSTKDRISLTHAPLLSLTTDHVAVAGLDGHSLLVFAVPTQGRKGVNPPRLHQWSLRRTAVAAVLDGKQASTICVDDEHHLLHFWQVPGLTVRSRPDIAGFETGIGSARWMPMAVIEDALMRRVCLLDRRGRLVGWNVAKATDRSRPTAPPADGGMDLLDSEAIGLVKVGPGMCCIVTRSPEGMRLVSIWPRMTNHAHAPLLCGPLPEASAALFAYSTARRQAPVLRGVAIRTSTSPERWQVVIPQVGVARRAEELPPPHEIELGGYETAVGLLARDAHEPPRLVVLSMDRKRLMVREPKAWGSALYRSESPIERCTVDPVGGRIALLTRDRELVVLDPTQATPLLVVRTDGGSPT